MNWMYSEGWTARERGKINNSRELQYILSAWGDASAVSRLRVRILLKFYRFREQLGRALIYTEGSLYRHQTLYWPVSYCRIPAALLCWLSTTNMSHFLREGSMVSLAAFYGLALLKHVIKIDKAIY
jgi:hypothetical protein